jgi:uncharacterized protein YciI
MHYLLFYEVAEDYVSRRAQFRDAHLEQAWKASERGELVLAGALANPVDGAVLLFRGESPEVAEKFARADPYVTSGAVKRWYVREWTTVAGVDAATPVRPRGAGKTSLMILLLSLLTASGSRGQELRAGAAKAVITPDVHAGKVYMAGFGNNRVATGVHDDLYVRCLALAVGESRVTMCSADLIGLFYDDVLKVREKLRAQAPEVTHLIVASTHDHEGPDTLGLWGPTQFASGMDEQYMEGLDDKIAATAARTVHSLEGVRLALGRDDHPLLALLQSDNRPPYVKDPYLFVMRFTSSATRRSMATLVNWSDHPETLGDKNTEITADYPHWLCQYVEEHEGGTALFFDGSIGGLLSTLGDDVALQDPDSGEVAKDGTWKKAGLFGGTVGRLAERAVQSEETVHVDALVVRKAVIFAPLANDWFRVAGVMGIYKNRKPLYTEGKVDPSTAEKDLAGYGKFKYATGRDTQTEVDYLELLSKGRVVAEIATVPGEIYPELVNGGIMRYPGADYPNAPFEPVLREHLKSKYQFIFGLANDELGYIIPKAEWDNQPPWLLGKKDRWYGEINSAGPEIAGAVTRALVNLIDQQ